MTLRDKSRVALLGLGAMGTRLGQTLVAAGHQVTVWNRSEERRATFGQLCAVASDPLSACADADIVIACLSNYAATYEVLDTPSMTDGLAGKTVVQLSTGTPDEARAFGKWAQEHGIEYLDGKIAVVPAQIGAAMTVILYAGARSVFDRCEPVLRCLAGRTTYLGEQLDRAVMGDFAFLSVYFAGIIGLLHGAAFSAAAGMDVNQFFELVPSYLKEIGERTVPFRDMIGSKDYSHVQSSLKTDLAGAVLLADTAERTGLHPLFALSIVAILQDAVANGYGALDTAALVECFRHPARPRPAA